MLAIALELSFEDPAYEDIASKFFEHFVAIADAMNTLGGHGLWDDQDGFYYDQLRTDGTTTPLKLRSMVGLIPLLAVDRARRRRDPPPAGLPQAPALVFAQSRRSVPPDLLMLKSAEDATISTGCSPSRRRIGWCACCTACSTSASSFRPSASAHSRPNMASTPYAPCGWQRRTVAYDPGESTTELFGGNSNWRGPVGCPMNYLLMEALERYHHFYGDDFKVECPAGSGHYMTLRQVAREINRRLCSLFLPDARWRRALAGRRCIFTEDPHWRGLKCFNEYFHADTGRGCGATIKPAGRR